MNAMLTKTDVFISYRREDSESDAWHLKENLAASLDGLSVFLDQTDLSKGADFRVELEQHLKSAETVLVLIGPRWLDAVNPETGERRLDEPDDFVCWEIATALALDKRIIPVLLLGARMPKGKELPHSIRRFSNCNAYPFVHRFWSLCIDELAAEILKSGKPPIKAPLILSSLAIAILLSTYVATLEAGMLFPAEWLLGALALVLGYHACRYRFSLLQLGLMASGISMGTAVLASWYVYARYGENFLPGNSVELRIFEEFVALLLGSYLGGSVLNQAFSFSRSRIRNWR